MGKHHARLKQLRNWVRSTAARRADQVVVLETPKLLEVARTSAWAVHAVFTSRDDVEGDDVFLVGESALASIADVASSQGLLAVVERPRAELGAGDVIALCGVQDPGNVGAIVRVAAGAGLAGVIVDAQSADPFGPKAVRASAGTIFTVPVVEVDQLVELPNAVAACVPAGGTLVYDADLTGPTTFVLGGEGQGLPDDLVARADKKLSLPMEGQLESLNVAVAAALLVYEAARQRRD